MTIPPRTLFWRAFLLIALLVVLSTFTWFQIFRFYEREPRTRQAAQTVVSVVNLTRAALITAHIEKRRELLEELSEREGIRIYPVEENEQLVPPPDRPGMQMVMEEVRRLLGPQTRFAVQREGVPGFWVSFHIEDDEYWVRLPRDRVERQITLQWLGWGSLALLLSLAAAWLIVSRMNRPLQALSQAALAIGHGQHPAPVDESGPAEISTLSRAFNQMSRDLARLDEDRTLILAGVSHDLRTPLSRLRLGVEMSSSDGAMKDGMIADIEEMDRIVNQFLDFARTVGGEQPVAADLSALTVEVVEHYRKLGRAVTADLQPVPEIPLRTLAMRRLINNLLDNALRYGGRDIGVAVRTEEDRLVLEVRDRGPGIPPEEVERLKQPFTRLETARSGGGGSGLGLAIIDRITRLHGGSFELLPRDGGGLVARISLPLH
jgi:two-component system, OmpR family, osmolarity sensor histidine kinase EnvZ